MLQTTVSRSFLKEYDDEKEEDRYHLLHLLLVLHCRRVQQQQHYFTNYTEFTFSYKRMLCCPNTYNVRRVSASI